MSTMSTKDDIQHAVKLAIEPVQNKVSKIEKHIESSDLRIGKMEKYMETNMGGSQISENITAQFEKMQKEIDELRGKKTESGKITKVAVFGGFKHFGDFDTAKNWIYEKLWKELLPTANDIYCKGDFTGILFC